MYMKLECTTCRQTHKQGDFEGKQFGCLMPIGILPSAKISGKMTSLALKEVDPVRKRANSQHKSLDLASNARTRESLCVAQALQSVCMQTNYRSEA